MKKEIFILTVFIFIFFILISPAYAQEQDTFPYLKPPDHLSTSSVIRLEGGELIRSATSREDMQTLVGSLFGTDTYFKDLHDATHRKELYKQVLREIVLMNVLEQDRKWFSYLTVVSEKTQLSLDLLNPEAMADFFSLYRALVDNRYLLDNNILNHSLNYLKQFGRMDTRVSHTWWQTIDKLKLHENTLDRVGKGLSLASFLSSIGSITLSALEAMNQEIAYQNLSLLSQTLKDMEGQGEYFPPEFKSALSELTKENDDLINSSFISDFTENFYYEWEKNKDNVTEKGLALFMQTTGKKAITTTLEKAGLTHAALPALAWSLSIQFSVHTILSGLKGIDLFHRYVITTDTLFYLRRMRDYAYVNQDASYPSFNLLDAVSQLYAYQLLEGLMTTTPQKLMFWKLGTRKLVLSEITATQEELRSLFPEIPEEPAKPEMITWEKTFGRSENDFANDIIQTNDGGYAICGYTESKSAGRKDIWLLKLDGKGNLLWDRNYGGSDNDEAESLIQTDDGGFVVAGWTLSYGAGWEDFWVLRLDNQGNIIWDKTFGRENDDIINSIVQVEDGYVIAGRTGYYGMNYWVIKLDNYGEIVWQRIFGLESGRYWQCFLIQTNDGGYALTGRIDHDSCLIKLDDKGNIVWEKTYGGNEDDYTYSIIQNKDDGYVLAGFTDSKGEGSRDVWVIKLDSQGNTIWDKTFGGRDNDGAYSIIQTSDGGYAVAGYTSSKGAGELDAWVIKLDELFIPEETAKEDETLKTTYALRDTGPAGGIIFYDKGSYSDGWRYLEAAPVSTECKGKEWSEYDTLIGGTETDIGTGQSNTAKIVKWLNSSYDSYYGRDRAAQLCYYLTEGGYRDWFLPSKDELNLMYKNLKVNGVGDFADNAYWSSSEYATYGAWYQGFDDGNQDYSGKPNELRVRAIRAF